jgi:hypothetical protein
MTTKITLKRVENAVRREMFGLDNPGFCKACGHEQEGCEPDMEGGTCESCGEQQVTGASNLLMEMI